MNDFNKKATKIYTELLKNEPMGTMNQLKKMFNDDNFTIKIVEKLSDDLENGGFKMNKKEYIDKIVEDMFCKIANHYNLLSGNVSPSQNEIIENFKEVIEKYVAQNDYKLYPNIKNNHDLGKFLLSMNNFEFFENLVNNNYEKYFDFEKYAELDKNKNGYFTKNGYLNFNNDNI